ncbi:molybdopterin oxidoreductase family protein [Marinobacter lacisalsi]|uniref:Molybdopterin oxidoreductase family protein n=1 Tax=Marinobacter lacisalsi TaxID=475979 RepID=A0ABV8QE53_9GAMM
MQTHHRSCTLCEAMCGVTIRHRGDTIVSIEGDPDDPHSRGHICPKGYALQDLHNDPDRLKTPLEKVDGQWVSIDWDSALDKAAARLAEIQTAHGDDAVAGYWGNPSSHNLGVILSAGSLRKALGSRNMFTAASLDQMPHQLTSYLMFGNGQMFTIPDIDRTDFMLMLGANPAVSNGSLMTAGDILGRLEGIRDRGGKVLLVDPRRNETARYVDEHHFIRPGTDALFLIGLIRHIIDRDLCDPAHLSQYIDDWDGLLALFRQFPMTDVSEHCGIPQAEIERIAEAFAAADRAVCYGRMGVATQSYGTLNHWLINVLNIITGNMDRPGGAMFTNPAFHKALDRRSGSFGTYHSRVRGLPEFSSSLPSAAMAEEMTPPGDGQIKALVCVAGNPALSTPNGGLMEQGLAGLEYMVAVDFYLNETSRHADLILPPTGPLEHEQYDIVFNLLAVRNLARYSGPLFEHSPDSRSDWEILQGLTARLAHYKSGEPGPFRMPDLPSPEQILDKGLRTGPYSERFTDYNSGEPVEYDEGLSLDVLRRYPHGLDLGPLQPQFPGYLFTPDQKIQARPAVVVDDLQRLLAEFGGSEGDSGNLRLIGRRDLRTNNSWMHNSQRLAKGRDRCALFMHPDDASNRGVTDGAGVRVTTRAGAVFTSVRLTTDIMRGVVSLPHGWGHDRDGVALRVASAHAGVNANDVTDNLAIDQLSGNAAFNGIPVQVSPVDNSPAAAPTNQQEPSLAER